MGRNTNPQLEPVVPVNGAIYRNNSSNGLIIDATGAQYLPSSATCLLSNTNYAKYVSLNTQTSSVQNQTISGNAQKNFGTVVPSVTSLNLSVYLPYFGGFVPAAGYPFTSRTGKYRYMGMGATNGTNSLGTQNPPGYKQATSNIQTVPVYNATTGAYVGTPTGYPIASWYDSSTSLFRVIGSPNSVGSTSPALLYTSSTGAAWTSTTPSMVSQVSAFDYRAFGGNTYYNVGATAVNQKAFFGMVDTNGSNQYTFFRTTNGGATITEVTTAITGAAAYYTPAGSSACRFNHNYDGTTVFVPANSGWVYSTNDGTSFSATSISGVVSSSDQSVVGAFSAANNSSTFMMIYNSRVSSNRVYVTTNGGQSFVTYSWTPAATLNTSYYQCPGDYDSANTRWCFVYGTTAGWYAAVSTNNGATWTHNLIQSAATDDPQMNIVFLGNVWYVFGSIGIWKSTDAATWTNISVASTTVYYTQPYLELTDYVMIGTVVIKKSDFSTTVFNADAIISNQSGYSKGLSMYLGSDAIMQVQTQYTTFPLLVTSATAGTANLYSPYPYTTQQTGSSGTYPNTIEYWRIK
jgi:hypothetical protein